MAWVDDVLWILGVLITAFVCVLYSKRAAREQDIVLALTSGIADCGQPEHSGLDGWWVWPAP